MSKARPPSGLSPVALEAEGFRLSEALSGLVDRYGGEPETLIRVISALHEAEATAREYAALARVEAERAVAASAGATRAGRAPRPGARKVDHDEIVREYLRLVDEGHSGGEARGILLKRGLASQSTIYTLTAKEK